MKIDIKRAVAKGNSVYFRFYRKGELWYATEFDEMFSVPADDTGDAAFNRTDKAILFMRYMRKWNNAVENS